MIATIASRATRRAARVAGALLAAVLATGVTGCAPRGVPHSTDTPREIRVLVYNIHAGKDGAGRDNLEQVAALVRELRVDVALLQEVDRHTRRSGGVDQPAELARRTGHAALFSRSLHYDGGEYGIALLTRWKVRDSLTVSLAVDPPQERAGGSREPRVAQVVTLEAPLGPLRIVNTHLDPSGDDRWRLQEISQVLKSAGAERRVLVGGDLNATPETATLDAVRSAGLRDAWQCGGGDGHTYPADVPRKRIDFLFMRGPVRCVSAAVVQTTASDHRPLLVILRLDPDA